MAELIRYFITAKCERCNNCIAACPEGAIYASEEKYGIDDSLCKGCGNCLKACPKGAIIHETDAYRSINREADSFFGGGAWPISGHKFK